MMKKVLLLLSFLVAFFVSNAQYPIVQFLGRDSSLVDSRGGMKARLILYSYTDTASANLERISQYAGAIIYVNTTNSLWLRNATATGWSRIAAGGGGNGVSSLGTSDYGLTIQNDSTYKVDTSQVSTKLWRQKGIDSVQNNLTIGLGTKLNITDTANMRVRLYAGSNVTITGTYPNLTIASSGGGGGSQDLQSVTDLGDSTTNRLVTNDSLLALNSLIHGGLSVGDTVIGTGQMIFFGNSVTAGYNLPIPTTQRFPAVTSKAFASLELNRGISGSRMIKLGAGDSSMVDRIYLIPTYGSPYKAIFFGYGLNDLIQGYDTTQFKTNYAIVLDSCIARGWPLNRIFCVTPNWNTSYLTGGNTQNFASAVINIARSKGVRYVDTYSFIRDNGGQSLMQADSLHPNVAGNIAIYHAISQEIRSEFKRRGNLLVTGDATLQGTNYILSSATGADGGIKASDDDNTGFGIYSGNLGYSYILSNGTQSIGFTGSNIIQGSSGQYAFNTGSSAFAVGATSGIGSEGAGAIKVTNGSSGFGTIKANGFLARGSTSGVVTVQGAAAAGTWTMTLPTSAGTSGYVLQTDGSGVTSWVAQSGGGTTYKIGTYNSQASSVKGATIVGDSIYMQAFSAENPGLVPAGGSGSTYLKGDGTWGTISGGTGYVDSVSNNAGGDSLIVVKGSTRYAYAYPAGSSGWSLSGNSTTGGWTEGNFLGTTGSQSLLIKTNNILRARIDSAGAAGIFRLYPATRTDSYLDFGTTANTWTMASTGIALNATSAVTMNSNSVATFGIYNGDVSIGSHGVTGTTKLNIVNASTTKSAINLGSTTLKTTPIAGDIDRDHSYLYITLGSAVRQKIATDIDTLTLTNKRITPRVGTTTSSSSLTINSDNSDRYTVTALAADMTINNPSGTPTDGQTLLIRIKDNGTARALTWSGSQFRVIGVTLPTTTVISKTVYIGLIWNSADSKWDVVSVNQEA